MLDKLKLSSQRWLIHQLGRQWLEYFFSNSMNALTEKIDPFLWTYNCKAQIIAIHQETSDTKTFVLLPNQHFKPALAGQHIELFIDLNGERLSRCYSLSSINTTSVAITVKSQPKGKVSSWLHDNATVGQVLDISSPRGDFVYKGQKKLLFITAGSGVTPCYSMLQNLQNRNECPDIEFYYRSRSSAETIFHTQLTNKACISYSRPLAIDSQNNILPAQLLQAYPDLHQRHIYLCGPSAFKQEVIECLESFAYDLCNLEVENFESFDSTPVADIALQQDVTVSINSQNIRFVIKAEDSHKSILEAAEDAGIEMRHGCRSGMCGSCKTHLVAGNVSGNKIGRSIYPCTAYAASTELILA